MAQEGRRDAGAQVYDYKRDCQSFGSQSKKMKYLLFLFPRSSHQAKQNVEFRHLTRNDLRIKN